MKNCKLVFVLAVILAASVAGCATSGNKPENIVSWKTITEADEFIGKWEGSINVAIPEDKEGQIPKSSIEVSIFLEYIKNTEEINSGMKVDMNKFLTDWLKIDEIKQAGITKDQLWDFLSEEFHNHDSIEVGGRYFITADLSGTADSFLHDDTGDFYISESRTQLKIVFHEVVKFGIGDAGFTEIVLSKK